MFKLAHLSDIHLPGAIKPRTHELINKRFFGYLNWHRKRIFIHQEEILNAIVQDLGAQNLDHTAITGDLTNIGLPQEFAKARDWLESFGTPETLSVIPGNHDTYVHLWTDPGFGHFQPFMQTCDTVNGPEVSNSRPFPYVKIYDPVAFIGLSSAIVTPPFCAYGKLGAKQRHALAKTLRALKERGLFRIVLIHHPPLPGLTRWIRSLRDAEALKNILMEHGAELVLFGHNHRWTANQLASKTGPVHLIQAPSASQGMLATYPLAGYNLFSIDKQSDGWIVYHTRRGFRAKNGPIEELASQQLDYK